MKYGEKVYRTAKEANEAREQFIQEFMSGPQASRGRGFAEFVERNRRLRVPQYMQRRCFGHFSPVDNRELSEALDFLRRIPDTAQMARHVYRKAPKLLDEYAEKVKEWEPLRKTLYVFAAEENFETRSELELETLAYDLELSLGYLRELLSFNGPLPGRQAAGRILEYLRTHYGVDARGYVVPPNPFKTETEEVDAELETRAAEQAKYTEKVALLKGVEEGEEYRATRITNEANKPLIEDVVQGARALAAHPDEYLEGFECEVCESKFSGMKAAQLLRGATEMIGGRRTLTCPFCFNDEIVLKFAWTAHGETKSNEIGALARVLRAADDADESGV